MADLKQIRYQHPDLSYTDDLRTYADASLNLTDALPAGTQRRLLDALGRVIAEIDEATGDITRLRHDDGAEGPRHALRHESAAPAVDDVIGRLAFQARNDAGSLYTGVELRALVKNAAAGAEEVWFEAGLMNAGAFVPSGLSLRVVAGEVKLFIDGAEAGAGGGGGGPLPVCIASHSVDFSIPNGSNTAQPFNSDVEDAPGWHDPVFFNTRITVDQDGLYQLAAFVRLDSNATGVTDAFFNVDGVASPQYGKVRSDGGGNDTFLNPAWTLRLSAGQYVELIVFQNSGASLLSESSVGAPRLSVVRLGG